jgi:hypothetical protein
MEKPSNEMDYSAQLHYPGKRTKKIQRKGFTNKPIKKEANEVEKTHQTGNYRWAHDVLRVFSEENGAVFLGSARAIQKFCELHKAAMKGRPQIITYNFR